MTQFDRKKHWENIYQTKELQEVSWYQPRPDTSLDFIQDLNIPKDAKIIDIGAGDSFLVDHLLDLGYENITILDISEAALERAKQRLGDRGEKVTWIAADVTDFLPLEQYDFWHDRAAFHFLTNEREIEHYLDTVQKSINKDGVLVIGTFSEEGPEKCSGIPIQQYSELTLTKRLEKHFMKISCLTVDHKTPSDAVQNFVFCSFKKK